MLGTARRPVMAAVLGGGGARGAYEVGVLSYLYDELLPELTRDGAGETQLSRLARLEVLCGASIGAFNASYLAASADDPRYRIGGLVELWKGLSLREVLRVRLGDVFRLLRDFLQVGPLPFARDRETHAGLIDLRSLAPILGKVCWRRIGRNLRSGKLSALSVAATEVATGRTTVFIETLGRRLPPWTYDPHVQALPARIGPRHVLASGAIPILFPPVELGGHLYVDGALRLNVPLSPALRLGANRLLVISLRPATDAHAAHSPRIEEITERRYASGPFLAGKMLNAILLDSTEQDLDRLNRINDVLEAGTKAFGASFAEVLDSAMASHRNLGLRSIRNLLLRPSRDLGELASDYVRSEEFSRKSEGLPQKLLRELVERDDLAEADFASYLLFDGTFAEQLIDLGRGDARARRDEFLHFLSPEPHTEAERAELELEAQEEISAGCA